MPITEIDIEIIVDHDTQDIGTVTTVPVPTQSQPITLLWTIVGGTLDSSDGITLNSPNPAISSLTRISETQWSAIDTNNSESSQGSIGYTIHFFPNATQSGDVRRRDPVIDNQPPPG